MNQLAILTVDQVTKKFSSQHQPVLKNISFSLGEGELLGLLGPSGCGKTTLLRIIAGFDQPSSGAIALKGSLIADGQFSLPPERRNTGMVFQDYALFPHLTIEDNIAFGLKTRSQSLSLGEIKKRVKETLVLVGLSGLEKRYPHQLSGGQQQRIALARALAPKPSLILLDEPLSNLDVQVREILRHEIRNILKAAGISGIFVTHDQEEALAVSDKIAVMHQGKIEQLASPEEVYSEPASRFVAEFVTQANFLPATKKGSYWETEIGNWSIEIAKNAQWSEQADLMLRQEDIQLKPEQNAPLIIAERHFLGREYRYCLETRSGKRIHALTPLNTNLSVGTQVQLSIPDRSLRIFPDSTRDD
ncbi:ABC transporter ATP-binding protein [Gloeocapsa sp. PCC 73106]|uniref:ABC transporter ATP-binding protein n=1 Tax=Gloeocapsa sp. PCC 73106 TaxID=102232 RepID=UPI0002AC1821|nr:ABC transporter ATP-binding protein [Gloeocapsa sp. PCC 73106]ELR96842.1 ABC-type spermidine/putrescine transport system, ATPase component [Gloeocapsa sp. PCC 73106]